MQIMFFALAVENCSEFPTARNSCERHEKSLLSTTQGTTDVSVTSMFFFYPIWCTDYTFQFVWRDVKKYIFRYLNICLTSKFGKLFDCTDRNAMVHRGACWINKLFPDYACVVSGIGSLYFMPHNHIRNYHPLHPRWFFPFDGCAALALNWSIQCLEISYRK